MISLEIRDEILKRLKRIEEIENVRIVLAIESGSRAWGFESPNSDYDVRFIYIRSSDWYVSVDLEEKRDVLEYGIIDDIDLNGWDLRKALRLFWKSNPSFIEWIQSPIKYIEKGCFAEESRKLLPTVYSCENGIYHYRSMAKTNYKGYLLSEKVSLKKYFYVLRPLLSVRWIEKYGIAAPIEFSKLLHLISDQSNLISEINVLLQKKLSSPEMGMSDPIPCINKFIENELNRLEVLNPQRSFREEPLPMLNSLFHKVLSEV